MCNFGIQLFKLCNAPCNFCHSSATSFNITWTLWFLQKPEQNVDQTVGLWKGRRRSGLTWGSSGCFDAQILTLSLGRILVNSSSSNCQTHTPFISFPGYAIHPPHGFLRSHRAWRKVSWASPILSDPGQDYAPFLTQLSGVWPKTWGSVQYKMESK